MTELYYPQPVELSENVHYFAHSGWDERIFLIEECSELIQSCTKSMRCKDNRDNMIEEMAHVYLTLNHVRHQMQISTEEIQAKMDEKMAAYGRPVGHLPSNPFRPDERPSREAIKKSMRVLADNGVDEDETETVLQAIGYTLFDMELFPEAQNEE